MACGCRPLVLTRPRGVLALVRESVGQQSRGACVCVCVCCVWCVIGFRSPGGHTPHHKLTEPNTQLGNTYVTVTRRTWFGMISQVSPRGPSRSDVVLHHLGHAMGVQCGDASSDGGGPDFLSGTRTIG